MRYKINTASRGCCSINKNSCANCHKRKKASYNWLSDIPDAIKNEPIVQIQFKNDRKAYYTNSNHLDLFKGDKVVVRAGSGFDIGEVSLQGELVHLAMKQQRYNMEREGAPEIIRLATQEDLDLRALVVERDHPTMIKARQLAADLGLEMKIGDVEYQADGAKAIFYYIADGRVDFRQLIRVLADAFRIRVEMKQIGARQEAARIGGIGPCGRELCCSSWIDSFVSVNTNAARLQDLSLNPQKLTGLCGKLKCCMNFEVQTYAEAQKRLPRRDVLLETEFKQYSFVKSDNLAGLVTYCSTSRDSREFVTITTRRAFDIINQNKNGQKPFSLEYDVEQDKPQRRSLDILSDNSLTRFDSGKGKRPNAKKGKRPNRKPRPNNNNGDRGERSAHRGKPRHRDDNWKSKESKE